MARRVAVALSMALPFAAAGSASGSGDASSSAWSMTPVTSVHARVQSDAPEWDETHQTFVSTLGDSFADKYRAALDTVNTASVEGALMYVQAEGINAQEQSVKCERKNGMKYVVFYAIQLTQTPNAVAVYEGEYCPFVAMDGGRCTPTSGDDVFPDECYQFNGLENETNIGPCVGGEKRDADFRAPYPDTYWFSFPNSCPLKKWAGKTDKCRDKYPGGMCEFGDAPDGKSCTFAYRILGYVALDDVVGITSLKNPDTGEMYADFAEFCEAGGVEFSAVVDAAKEKVSVNESLPFWKSPTSEKANAKRAQQMVNAYTAAVSASDGQMVALPDVDELTSGNPPCYVNDKACAAAEFGCRRVGYFQGCEACDESGDDSCVVAPKGFSFPELAVDDDFELEPSSMSGDDSGSSVLQFESESESDEADSGSSLSVEPEAQAVRSASASFVDSGSSDADAASTPKPTKNGAASSSPVTLGWLVTAALASATAMLTSC